MPDSMILARKIRLMQGNSWFPFSTSVSSDVNQTAEFALNRIEKKTLRAWSPKSRFAEPYRLQQRTCPGRRLSRAPDLQFRHLIEQSRFGQVDRRCKP
jgi:hypothetical protein